MERDKAERLARASVDVPDLTLDQVKTIIHVFLQELQRCPVCQDASADFKFGRKVTSDELSAADKTPGAQRWEIKVGTVIKCPVCGGFTESEGGLGKIHHGDPAQSAWYCYQGLNQNDCRHPRGGLLPHAGCGYRISLEREQ